MEGERWGGALRRLGRRIPGAKRAYDGVGNLFRRAIPVRPYRMMMFYMVFGYRPNLKNPRTFNEKILYKSIFDKRDLLSVFCDKVRVREYVKRKVGDAVLLPTLHGVYDKVEEIDFSKLPEEYALKPNHASGLNLFVRKGQRLDERATRRTLRRWLREDYYVSTKAWGYKNVKPLIMVEELLLSHGDLPNDYKFFCFQGQPRLVQVDYGRFHQHRRNLYDLQWNLMKGAYAYPNHEVVEPRPASFDQMCRLAAALSVDTDFVRVDLYDIDGKIYFGELTNYPEDGLGRFSPASLDGEIGSFWTVPREYVSADGGDGAADAPR